MLKKTGKTSDEISKEGAMYIEQTVNCPPCQAKESQQNTSDLNEHMHTKHKDSGVNTHAYQK